MKKITTLALIGALAFATPVLAQSANDQDIKSDVNALNKDNAALQKDQNNLAQHRADKAADKANGESGKQAVDSMKIGADKTAIAEKQTEKSIDKKILKHHKKKASHDNADSGTSTAPSSN